MNRRVTTIVCLLLLCAAAARAGLARDRAVFEAETAKIEAQRRADEAKATADYVRYIESVISRMMREGDDFGVRPAKAELARFRAEGTMPEKAKLGTPERVEKGQGYYRDALRAADARMRESMQTLASRYTDRLRVLVDTADGDAAQDEIRRVAHWLGEPGEPDLALDLEDRGASAPLPGMPGGLLAVYLLDRRRPKVPDELKRNSPAVVKRARWLSHDDGECLRFDREMGMLTLLELRLRASWSAVVSASFRPIKGDRSRVLFSHGFRRHHVVVDEVGELGVEDGDFRGSGYNVDALNGWHSVGVVVSGGRTMFFVDGKPVGIARAACTKPINVIGNQATGRQQWGGSLKGVYFWSRALSLKEMANASQRLAVE